MSTSSALEPVAAGRPTEPVFDSKFAKRFVIACGLVPGILLVWDAFHGNLGVNEVNFAIRSTGMLGLVFLTLSLCITPLRRLTGWNWLIGVRRNIGVYGFVYIAAHFSIFFWYDRAHDVGSTLNEIVERVYLWFGTGSLLLLIPLAITSTDAMVSRLGAKRWKALHRLAYVAVLFGVVHFYLLVKADTSRPIAFTVAFGSLMLYRLVRHYVDLRGELAAVKGKLAQARKQAGPKPRKFWQGELVVARVFDETPHVKTFRMVNPGGGPLPFEHIAGQYLNISTLVGGARVGRSYTIASSPTRSHYVEISVKRDGMFSQHLHASVKEGDRVRIGAPAGRFYFAGDEAKRIVLVAGGVGITPMMSVIRSLTDRCWDGEIYLLFAVRTRQDIIFERELEQLQQRFPNLRVQVSLSNEPAGTTWTGARGRITKDLIRAFVPDLQRGPVMLCGPDAMMQATRALFVELGVPDAEIREEAFVSPAAPAAASADAAPAATPAAEPEPATGETPNVSFRKSGRVAELPGDLTVLEVAEDCGVAIPYECRSGICGQCKTKLVAGRVTMEVQDALSPGDRSRGLILACQARAVRDVVVDA